MSAESTLVVALAALLGCVSSDAMIVAQHTTTMLRCTVSGRNLPYWFVNETAVGTDGECYRSSSSNGQNKTATLTVDGNCTFDIFDFSCKVLALPIYSTTLKIQGRLPSPEKVRINESVNSSTIGWSPPYSTMNNDTIHVDPHITHYTVYIFDNYSGNSIVKENVTGMGFTFNASDGVCRIYRVSAWNAGGEGELSEPVQESTPHVEYVSVAPSTESDMLHIHVDLNGTCPSRMPEFFLITLMMSDGRVLNETTVLHQPTQVDDFNISLPLGVAVCSLHVKIRAGNSAGMSLPSEAVEVDCGSTDSTTTASTATVDISSTVSTTNTTTQSSAEDSKPQEGHAKLIAISIGVIAAIAGVLIAAATVTIICCRKYRRRKVDLSEPTDNYYTESTMELSGNGH